MSEASHGRDTRPSHGAFRVVEGTRSNNPKLNQARRLTSSAEHHPGFRKRLRSAALAFGIATGAITGAGVFIDGTSKPGSEYSLATYPGKIESIDLNKYLIKPHVDFKDGTQQELAIRNGPSRSDKLLEISRIKKVNGVEWDGNSNFVIENTPIVMSEDPMTGYTEAPWFVVSVESESISGHITQTLGFISHSSATDAHITRLDDEGGIVNARFEKGQIVGKNEYGETVLPTERIGLANIADSSLTTQATNSQP